MLVESGYIAINVEGVGERLRKTISVPIDTNGREILFGSLAGPLGVT